MKRKTYILASLLLTLFAGAAAIWNYSAPKAAAQKSDAVENLGVVPTEYNARNEFSLTQGGTTGVWNYGYSTSDTDNTFTLYPTNDAPPSCSGGQFQRWFFPTSGDFTPQIAANTAAVPCSSVPPDALFMHPGPTGRRSVLRWSAPAAGTYQITGVFGKQDPSATSDLKILRNVAEPALFAANLNSTIGQQPFNFTVTVAAGDTIDFSVGWGNGSYNSDGSLLTVTIGQPVTACLIAPANLQVFAPAENSPTDVASVNTNASLAGNATYTNMGKAGRAFEFDGVSDYVRIEDNAAQRPATALTAEGWFKFDNASGIVSLISKPLRSTSLNSYTLYLEGGQLRGLVGNASQFTRVFSNFTPQTGVWHHLAFTYDFTGGVSTLKLYANGTEVTTGQDGTPNLPISYDANPFPLLIGGEYETNAPGFWLDGQADEVSIYGRALAQSEIFDLVQQGSFGKCQPAPCAQTPNDLVSWFAGEQNALDSRSNNHGALAGGTTFQSAKVGSGFKFDGVDDRVEIPDSLSLKPQNLTVETWVQFDSLSSNTSGGAPSGLQYLVFKKNQSAGNFEGYSLAKLGNNRFRLGFAPGNGNPGAVVDSTTVATTGVFYHVAGTYDGSVINLYVNGQLEASAPYNLPLNYDTRPVFLGTSGEAAFDGRFNGVLDEISIYDRAITAAEVSSVYNAASSGKCKPAALNPAANLIGFWTADGDARDLAGEDQNAANNGAAFAVGKVGQAFRFTNDPQNVSIPDSPAMRPANFTIEAWAKSDNNSGVRHIFAKTLGSGTANSYVLWNNSGTLNAAICSAGAACDIISAPMFNTGEWHHVAFTFDDAGNSLRLYVDGTQVAAGASSLSIGYDSHAVLIGADYANEVITDSWRGLLDEVSFSDRALTPSEIAAVYNAGSAGKIKSKPVIGIQPLAAQTKAAESDRLLAPATVQLAAATVSFADVISGGTVSENGIDLGFYPPLPASVRFTGLAYDIRTTALYQQGSADDVQVCFNVPSLAALNFANLRILHLENGVWVNRSAATNTSPVLCTDNLTSLSPFAIVEALAPTAARVSVSGRVADATGAALGGVSVALTDSQGRSISTRTNNFGRYSFQSVAAGEIYVVSVAGGKRYTFTVSARAVNVQDAVENVDFTADSDAFRFDETKP